MSDMMRSAIIRVRRESDNQVVGVGFLIDEERKVFLTCAHVINSAIDVPNNEEKPRTLISVDFPFIDAERPFEARVIHFYPEQGKKIDDIAMLEILAELPPGAKAAQLATTNSYSGHEFGVYGFPVGFEANGQYVEGKLQAKLVNGRIQAVGTSNLGYFVERGFSGSPVYDKDLDAVIGMMMQVDVDAEKRVAFISPVDVISVLYYNLHYKKFDQSHHTNSTSKLPPSSGKWLQRVDIFISSPGDVAEEREAILRVIERLNRLSYIRSRYVLNPLLYEKEVPPEAGDHAQMIVDRYMDVEDSYLLICLMWNRMGTPFTHPETGEEFQSGTEYEFTVGYRANEKNGKPYLFLYRKDVDDSDADEDQNQKEKVNHFFEQFEGDGTTFRGLYKKFSSVVEFETMLFEHIERKLHDNPPDADHSDTRIDRETRSAIIEESRRLDAAMPSQCRLGHATEVRVMVCLPESKGLSDLLPDYTSQGERIDKRDVRQGSLAVKFPLNADTGQPESILATVEIESTHFDIPKPEQNIELSPKVDSGLLVFTLTPRNSGELSRVHVRVTTLGENGKPVVLGSAALHTKVVTQIGQLGATLWSVVLMPLAALTSSLSQREKISDEEPQSSEFPDQGGKISGRDMYTLLPPNSSSRRRRDRTRQSASAEYKPPSRTQRLKYLANQLDIEEIEMSEEVLESKVLEKFNSEIEKNNIMQSDSLDTIRKDAEYLAALASRIDQLIEDDEARQLVEQAQDQTHLASKTVEYLESLEQQVSRLVNDPDPDRITHAQELYQRYQSNLRTLGIEPDEFAAARHIQDKLKAFIDTEHEILYVLDELQEALRFEGFNRALELINHLKDLTTFHFHLGIRRFYWEDSYTKETISGVNNVELVLEDKMEQIDEMQHWTKSLPDRARIHKVQSKWQVIMNEAGIAISSGKFEQAEERVKVFQQEIKKDRRKFRPPPFSKEELKSQKAAELYRRYEERLKQYEEIVEKTDNFLFYIQDKKRKFDHLIQTLRETNHELREQQKKTRNLWRIWLLWGLSERKSRIQNLRSKAKRILVALEEVCPNHPDLKRYKEALSE